VHAGREATTDPEASNRLRARSEQFRSRAERDPTPALGTLDRIQHALKQIAAGSDDQVVSGHLEAGRNHVFSFLETFDDQGMGQHGRGRNG